MLIMDADLNKIRENATEIIRDAKKQDGLSGLIGETICTADIDDYPLIIVFDTSFGVFQSKNSSFDELICDISIIIEKNIYEISNDKLFLKKVIDTGEHIKVIINL